MEDVNAWGDFGVSCVAAAVRVGKNNRVAKQLMSVIWFETETNQDKTFFLECNEWNFDEIEGTERKKKTNRLFSQNFLDKTEFSFGPKTPACFDPLCLDFDSSLT